MATSSKKPVEDTNKRGPYTKSTAGDVVYLHKSRGTGSTVAVLKGPAELGFGPSTKWVDLCLTHRQFSIFETRISATSAVTHSDAWCSDCEDSKRARAKKKKAAAA
jgi:hypothetical protein